MGAGSDEMTPWRWARVEPNAIQADTDAGSPRIVLHNLKLNTRIHVIGVAHCSQRSNNDVAHSIRTIRPSVVLLELCQERRGILSQSWPPEPLPELSFETFQAKWSRFMNPLFWALQLPSMG